MLSNTNDTLSAWECEGSHLAVTHKRVQIDREHGQSWVTCLDCGTTFSVVESNRGTGFELISDGDGYCEDNIN